MLKSNFIASSILASGVLAQIQCPCSVVPPQEPPGTFFILPEVDTVVRRGSTFRIIWESDSGAQQWRIFLLTPDRSQQELFLTSVQDTAIGWHADWQVPGDLPAVSGYFLELRPEVSGGPKPSIRSGVFRIAE